MKYIILFLALSVSAHAQSPATTPTQTSPAASDSNTTEAAQATEKFHADALQLADLSGVRAQAPVMWKSMVDDGRKQMIEQCELCSKKFMDEWAKRMLERMKTDEVIQIWVTAYEKHFTPEELTSLVELQKKTNAHEKITMSTALAAKLETELPAVKNEFNDGFAKLASDLGSTITNEIQQEHPEYLNTSDKDSQGK
jgi:hypothetical protein